MHVQAVCIRLSSSPHPLRAWERGYLNLRLLERKSGTHCLHVPRYLEKVVVHQFSGPLSKMFPHMHYTHKLELHVMQAVVSRSWWVCFSVPLFRHAAGYHVVCPSCHQASVTINNGSTTQPTQTTLQPWTMSDMCHWLLFYLAHLVKLSHRVTAKLSSPRLNQQRQ